MRATLAVAGIIAIVVGLAYSYVAMRLVQRPAAAPAAKRALSFFAMWWAGLALNITLVGGTYLAGAFGVLTFEMQLIDSFLQRLLLTISLVGLMYYLLYLLTGRDLFVPLAVAYGAYFLLLTYTFFAGDPSGLFVGDWRTDVTFSQPTNRFNGILTLAFVILPPVVASLAYFRLFFRMDDASMRWRIALVSWAIVGWWAVAVVAGQRAALDNGPLQSFHRLLSLAAALLVLAAYHPPAWARQRWGLHAAPDPSA